MGIKCANLYSRKYTKKKTELRVGLLGLDNAGKTSILYQLKHQRNVDQTPNRSLNMETLIFEKFVLRIWEIAGGGRSKNRMLWQHYNQNTRAIIFVVDSSNLKDLSQAIELLHWLCWRPELSDAIFLIYANKQDLPEALPSAQLAELFQMDKLLPKQMWAIQSCCAKNGIGLMEGLYKLLHMCEISARKKKNKNFREIN